jgi:hypothetical protein
VANPFGVAAVSGVINSNTNTYYAVGPLPPRYADGELEITINAATTSTYSFAAALANQPQANAANAESGRSLIRAGSTKLGNLQGHLFPATAGNIYNFKLPIPGRTNEQPQYLIVAVQGSDLVGNDTVLIKASTGSSGRADQAGQSVNGPGVESTSGNQTAPVPTAP